MLKPRDIANKSFEKANRGYKFEDVDIFMSEVTMSYTELYETNQQLEQQLEVLAEKIEEYRESEDSLRSVLLGAQKLGDNIVRESRAKAEVTIREANAKAAEIIAGANTQSMEVLRENEKKIAFEQSQLDELKRDVTNFKKELAELYRMHLEMIDEMPEYEEAVAAAAEAEAEPEPEPAEVAEQPAAEPEPVEASAEETGFRVEIPDDEPEAPVEEPEPADEEDESDYDSVAKEYDFSGLKFQFTDEIDKKK